MMAAAAMGQDGPGGSALLGMDYLLHTKPRLAMVLPGPILVIKFLGLFQGVYLTFLSRKVIGTVTLADVTECSVGPPSWLLVYRSFAFLYALSIGVTQFIRVGPRGLVFFTIWNWWILTFYFGLGALTSWRAISAQRRREQQGVVAAGKDENGSRLGPGATGAGVTRQAGLAEKMLVAIYHIEAPIVWVIDLITWTVLVPMLLANPDQAKRDHWIAIMYSFTSYNQHGFNAVLMLLEMCLSRIPTRFVFSGYLAMLMSVYAAWSTLHYVVTGRFIYPFLDVQRPYAWVGYLGLYLTVWAAVMAFLGADWLKCRVLGRCGLRLKAA